MAKAVEQPGDNERDQDGIGPGLDEGTEPRRRDQRHVVEEHEHREQPERRHDEAIVQHAPPQRSPLELGEGLGVDGGVLVGSVVSVLIAFGEARSKKTDACGR